MSVDSPILVATEVASDAELVRKLLNAEFDNVIVSTDPERAIQDFENIKPAVLVLAFTSLEKAERYYLGLYRLSVRIHTLSHRTLILCGRNDLQRVYELCRKQHFDDYILFWSTIHDTFRLRMAVHQALRQMTGTESGAPTAVEFAAQARRLAGLEVLLEQNIARNDEKLEGTSRAVANAERDIGAAVDSFSLRLAEGKHRNMIEIRDHVKFQQEIDHLKTEGIKKQFQTVVTAVRSAREWGSDFKEDLAPKIESVRAMQAMTERVRPTILVVDDDEFQHKLLKGMLKDASVELAFVTSGSEALIALRKLQVGLVLMDMNLPDFNGIEVTRRLKSVDQWADIPVVMITGQSEKHVVIESRQAGAADFLVKPFDKNILLAKVNTFLQGGASP